MKQKKLMFNFFVNRNWSKLTDTRKRVKILADNRKSHHPIETLDIGIVRSDWLRSKPKQIKFGRELRTGDE